MTIFSLNVYDTSNLATRDQIEGRTTTKESIQEKSDSVKTDNLLYSDSTNVVGEINHYTYVNSNPIKLVDQYGLQGSSKDPTVLRKKNQDDRTAKHTNSVLMKLREQLQDSQLDPKTPISTKARRKILEFMEQSKGDPWLAWRTAALTRITTDFSDPILARVEHYLLRYAVGSYGLFNYSSELSKRDFKYHPVRRIACIFGACKYDPSLPTWEVRGFIHGFQQYELNRKKNISNKIESETKREVRAIKFMLSVTKLTLALIYGLKKGMIMRRNFEAVHVLLQLDLAKRKAKYTHYEGSPMR